jgi:hypothetical protein
LDKNGARDRNRTSDTRIFKPDLLVASAIPCAEKSVKPQDTNQTLTPSLSNSEGVSRAAEWLSNNRADCPQPIIPTLRNRFDLSAKEAINAITLSHRINCGGTGQ